MDAAMINAQLDAGFIPDTRGGYDWDDSLLTCTGLTL